MITVKRPAKFQKRFESMTKAERRVVIAKDVIAQLRSGKIEAKHLVYIKLPADIRKKLSERPSGWYTQPAGPSVPFHELLKASANPCWVCAIGAMCVASAKAFDGIALNGWDNTTGTLNDDPMRDSLQEHFSESQLRLIEFAFERGRAGYSGQQQESSALVFMEPYRTATERLRAIMKNIIQNNGTFKP